MFFLRGCDDAVTPWQPLTFPFSFYYQPVTQYSVSSNGYVQFSGDDAGQPVNMIPWCPPNPLVRSAAFGLGMDLCVGACYGPAPSDGGACSPAVTSDICAAVTGTAPDRELVVTYKGIVAYQYPSSTSMTFTLTFVETSNVVDMVYQTMEGDAGTVRFVP